MNYSELTEFLDEQRTEYFLNEPLSGHCSFRIGGPADIFIEIRSKSELSAICCFCNGRYPMLVMGNGSNLLMSDAGYRGVVLHIGSMFSGIEIQNDRALMCCAGAPLSAVCNFALSESLSGLEFAYGIPGSLGGAVYMNAGAYCGQMSNVVKQADYITLSGESGCFSGEELNFGYRQSAFKDSNKIITSAIIELKPASADDISLIMRENIIKRKTKQPLEFPSAGSVFKRPDGCFAGALIEQCGLKGYTIGGAQVSEKHAGFIINVGGATCEDVKRLIALIQDTVYKSFSVALETEIKIIG